MRRFLLLLLAAAITAVLILSVVRSGHRSTSAVVLSLLPRETEAAILIPDPAALRAQFKTTDLYGIWCEPAVQDFLRKPRAKFAPSGNGNDVLDDLQRLGATDLFAAVAGSAAPWKTAGGFRFKKSADAERVLRSWQTRIFGGASGQRAAIIYRQHEIVTNESGDFRLCTSTSGDWFLAASDPEELERMIDRRELVSQDKADNLADDQTFAASLAHMPKNYLALLFGRPDRLAESLPKAGIGSLTAGSFAGAKSFCMAVWFDAGKMRDTTFVMMPRRAEGTVTRKSMGMGTDATVFYLNALAELGTAIFNENNFAGNRGAQPLSAALATSGITAGDWNAAFGSEFSLIAEWPAESRWPSAVATTSVKDAARARQVVERLSASAEANGLSQHRVAGVQYFSAPTEGQMFAIAPTLAFSERTVVFGIDNKSIELAMGRAAADGRGLAAVPIFQAAETMLNDPPQQSFAYLDSALLYTRGDAALRPMLLMSAAFVPSINDVIDPSRFPPVAAITKHLSPIIMSQRYLHDGYLAESAGPVTANALLVGAVALAGAGTSIYQHHLPGSSSGTGLWPASFFPSRNTSPAPSPTPPGTP